MDKLLVRQAIFSTNLPIENKLYTFNGSFHVGNGSAVLCYTLLHVCPAQLIQCETFNSWYLGTKPLTAGILEPKTDKHVGMSKLCENGFHRFQSSAFRV